MLVPAKACIYLLGISMKSTFCLFFKYSDHATSTSFLPVFSYYAFSFLSAVVWPFCWRTLFFPAGCWASAAGRKGVENARIRVYVASVSGVLPGNGREARAETKQRFLLSVGYDLLCSANNSLLSRLFSTNCTQFSGKWWKGKKEGKVFAGKEKGACVGVNKVATHNTALLLEKTTDLEMKGECWPS